MSASRKAADARVIAGALVAAILIVLLCCGAIL